MLNGKASRTSSLNKGEGLLKSFSAFVGAVDISDNEDTSEGGRDSEAGEPRLTREASHLNELVKHKAAIALALRNKEDKKPETETTAAKTIDRLTKELQAAKSRLGEVEEELNDVRDNNKRLKRRCGELEDEASAAGAEASALRRLMAMSGSASASPSPPPTGLRASQLRKKALSLVENNESFNRMTILEYEADQRSTALAYYTTRFNSILRVQRLQSLPRGDGNPLDNTANQSTTSNGTTFLLAESSHMPEESAPVPQPHSQHHPQNHFLPSLLPLEPAAYSVFPSWKPTGIWYPNGVPNTHYHDPRFIEVPATKEKSQPRRVHGEAKGSVSGIPKDSDAGSSQSHHRRPELGPEELRTKGDSSPPASRISLSYRGDTQPQSPSPRREGATLRFKLRDAPSISERLGSGPLTTRANSPSVPVRHRAAPIPQKPEDTENMILKEVKQVRVSQRFPLRGASVGSVSSRRGSVSSVMHLVSEKGVRCESVPCFSRTAQPSVESRAAERSRSAQSANSTRPAIVFDYLSKAHILSEENLLQHQRKSRGREESYGGTTNASYGAHYDPVTLNKSITPTVSPPSAFLFNAPPGVFQQASGARCALKLDPPSATDRNL